MPPEGSTISIEISTAAASYQLTLGFLSGRIDPMAGERLVSTKRQLPLIERKPGAAQVTFHHTAMGQDATFPLREPERISLPRYLDYDPRSAEAAELNDVLRYAHFYSSRSVNLYKLRKFGSEAGHETWLRNNGEDLWSVLRNLHLKRDADDRYDTILRYMSKSFPGFKGLDLEATSPTVVYGSFSEKGVSRPIRASGVSDGHLQMLLLLTALFAEGRSRARLLMFDEPDFSLHPWALATLAEAIEDAARGWQKQILLATHSPVLLSQFDPSRILAVEPGERGARIRRLSDLEDVKDLLEQYAPGSLYMAELIGAQSPAVATAEK